MVLHFKIDARYRITDNGKIVQGLQGVNLSQDQLLRIQQQVRYAMQGAYYAMQGVLILHYAECTADPFTYYNSINFINYVAGFWSLKVPVFRPRESIDPFFFSCIQSNAINNSTFLVLTKK